MQTISASEVKQQAVEAGFNLVGIARAVPSPTLAAYERWIVAGMHGEMGYMARADRVVRRRDLTAILPGARSLILVVLDYGATLPSALLSDPARGRIAAYAWGLDYHDVMGERLERFAAWLNVVTGGVQRVYVDTGAILERSHAHEAGLGFIGKNTMLIRPRRGSFFFLGEIITTLEFDTYDSPGRATMCGSCSRCLNACPTSAFPAPHVLDSRRCISYLTIEHKGWIDRALRPLMGNWVYGCDICQEVCPFQRFAPASGDPVFEPAGIDRAAPPLSALLALDDAGFAARFRGSPIFRIKRERLVRNACIAAGNSGNASLIPLLTALLADESALVRGHAAWALGRFAAEQTGGVLAARLAAEHDEEVRAELIAALPSNSQTSCT